MAYVGRKRAIVENYDLSGRAESTSVGYVCVLAQTLKGRVGVPYMFSKYDEASFIEKLGDTTDDFAGPAMCLTAIKHGANLVVIPVAHYTDIADATSCTKLSASCVIPDRGGVPTSGAAVSAAGPFLFQLPIAGSVTAAEIGPYIFATGTNDKFSLRVRHDSVWGSTQTVTFAAATTTAQVACDQINAQTTGVNATVNDDGTFTVATTDANDDVEILTIANDAYSTVGVSEAVHNHTAGTTGLLVSIDSGANQEFEMAPTGDETSTFYLTSAQAVAQLTGLTGATASGLQGTLTITSSTTGTDSTVQIGAASTALAAFGFDSTEHAGVSGEAVDAWNLELTGPGAYGNSSVVYFYENPLNTDRMDYRRVTPGEREVYFANLSRDPNDPYFWRNYINIHDEGVYITQTEAPNAAPYDWPALNSVGITLSGGADGATVLSDSDWIGHPTSKTGFYSIDKVKIPIINFFCFGTESNVVHEYAKIWAESRIAKFYHGASPAGMTADECVDYREGLPPDYSHAAFNSASMSLITKEPEVYDARNNGRVAINGLPFMAAAITRTEEVYGPGISPFGIKRGQCPGVLNIEDNVDEDSAAWDLLSLHNINTVVMLKSNDRNWGNEGTYLWGGYTMQKNPSKMQDWAVVWLLKAYELRMYPILQRYIHDPNRPATWGELKREMAPMFREDLLKDKFAGIFMAFDDGSYYADGELKGAVLNTPDSIDRGEYICRILIKPYSQIGWPIAQIGTMRTGDPWATYATSLQLPNFVRL